MAVERSPAWRRCQAFVLLWFLGSAVAPMTAALAQQLTLGPVALKLGEADSEIVQALQKDHKVERIDGGWSIQPLQRGRTAPGVGVRTVDGRIEGVSLIWGPGYTPSAEDIAEQLAHALPNGTKCDVRNVRRLQEGGTVRTLEWLCGTYKVTFVTGVWSTGGNTASIDINKKN